MILWYHMLCSWIKILCKVVHYDPKNVEWLSSSFILLLELWKFAMDELFNNNFNFFLSQMLYTIRHSCKGWFYFIIFSTHHTSTVLLRSTCFVALFIPGFPCALLFIQLLLFLRLKKRFSSFSSLQHMRWMPRIMRILGCCNSLLL